MSDAPGVLPPNPSPLRRRFRQFGMRTLLVLMLLAALGFGCLEIFVVRPVRRREAAARKIADSGGLITYQHEFDHPLMSRSEPQVPGPAWLRRLFGDHLFLTAHTIHLSQESPSQRFDWSAVSAFPEAQRLWAVNVPLDAEGAQHLARLTELRSLRLENAGVTDDLLSVFSQHEHLNMVFLPRNPLRGPGLAAWKPLKTITQGSVTEAASLDLSFTELDDAGLKFLAHQTELVWLDLKQARVSNLAPLAKLTKLSFLGVNETRVNDAGLEGLSNLEKLETLDVRGTRVTEKGLEPIKRLPSLISLKRPEIRSDAWPPRPAD